MYEPDAELAAVIGSVEACGTAPKAHRYAWQRARDMQLRQRCIDKLMLLQSQDAAAFAATDEFEFDGSLSAADWIRHNTKVNGATAARSLQVGQQMASLAGSVTAMSAGEIGFAHLEMIARTAVAVTESPDAPPFDERPLLQKAREHSVGRFSHDCGNARHAADAAGFLSDHLTEAEWNALEMNACAGGFLLRGRLDSVSGAVVRSALEPLAKKNGAADTRRLKQRMADALTELANHALDSGTLPTQGGQRPHVQVTTTLETLNGMRGAPAGQMQYAGPVSYATVQRFACDSGITRILVDAKSAITDVSKSMRFPSAPMRRALVARDGGCVWPGCERPASWTAAHHIKNWSHWAETEIPNLCLLCFRHHQKCHEGGWSLAWTDDGRVLTIPPPPDWPVPRGGRAPTAAEELAHEERERAQREHDERLVGAAIELRLAAHGPPELVPF